MGQHHQCVGVAAGAGLQADGAWGLWREGLGGGVKDGPRPTPVPTAASRPTVPLKVPKFMHWAPSV